MIRAALLSALAGCWTQVSQPPPAPPPSAPAPQVARRIVSRSQCEITVDHLVDVMGDELSKVPDFVGKLDTIRDLAVASCDETHWSGELMNCLETTSDSSVIQQCAVLFSAEQTQDLMQRMTEALTGIGAPPPIGP
ncbi:MAG: hypothetical protein QM831_05640 [Kofleriaceae bacterium]